MSDVLSNRNIKLISGLGNPGRKYAKTRHNVGFKVLDSIAGIRKVKFRSGRGKYDIADFPVSGRKIRLIKPKTYMNDSGFAIHSASHYFAVQPENILTITDDSNLPLGKIRIRTSGSDGGHNGLKSMIEHLETTQFPRLRIGIGAAPENVLLEDYVLGKFSDSENKKLGEVIELSVELIFRIINQGIESVKGTYSIL